MSTAVVASGTVTVSLPLREILSMNAAQGARASPSRMRTGNPLCVCGAAKTAEEIQEESAGDDETAGGEAESAGDEEAEEAQDGTAVLVGDEDYPALLSDGTYSLDFSIYEWELLSKRKNRAGITSISNRGMSLFSPESGESTLRTRIPGRCWAWRRSDWRI